MKTTLTLLIVGLIFLVNPITATADGRHEDNWQNHYNGWVEDNHHDQCRTYDHHDERRSHRYEQKCHHRNHRTKKHLRRELRRTRRELRRLKRQVRRHHRRDFYTHPYQDFLITIPHIVFQFDL